MGRYKIHGRVEHISTGVFKALVFALPRDVKSFSAKTEMIEAVAGSGEQATLSLFRIASTLAESILMRGDAVEGLEIT